jgi:hypothetical protein
MEQASKNPQALRPKELLKFKFNAIKTLSQVKQKVQTKAISILQMNYIKGNILEHV